MQVGSSFGEAGVDVASSGGHLIAVAGRLVDEPYREDVASCALRPRQRMRIRWVPRRWLLVINE